MKRYRWLSFSLSFLIFFGKRGQPTSFQGLVFSTSHSFFVFTFSGACERIQPTSPSVHRFFSWLKVFFHRPLERTTVNTTSEANGRICGLESGKDYAIIGEKDHLYPPLRSTRQSLIATFSFASLAHFPISDTSIQRSRKKCLRKEKESASRGKEKTIEESVKEDN